MTKTKFAYNVLILAKSMIERIDTTRDEIYDRGSISINNDDLSFDTYDSGYQNGLQSALDVIESMIATFGETVEENQQEEA